MLAAIERKLAAILTDGLVTRTHLTVAAAPASTADPPVGRGTLAVWLAAVDTTPQFGPEFMAAGAGGLPPRRRVLPVNFTAQLHFLLTPSAADAVSLADARALQLTDVSLAAHLLAGPDVLNGQAFIAADGDAGYRVLRFGVGTASLLQVPPSAALTASLGCTGEAEIWPPGVVSPEGVIARLDPVQAVLPIPVHVDDPVVRAGATTGVRLRSVAGKRLLNPTTGATSALQLAVTVTSALPPAQRGSIQSGVPGLDAGVRIVTTSAPEVVVIYQAPAAPLGPVRTEYVAFHLATPDGGTGVFLGSAAVNLLP